MIKKSDLGRDVTADADVIDFCRLAMYDYTFNFTVDLYFIASSNNFNFF